MPRRVSPPFRFHIDACLGGKGLVQSLNALLLEGESARAHHTVYRDGTSDIDWLGTCASDGWVILTSDAAILRRSAEIACVRAAAGVIVLFGQKLKSSEIDEMMPLVLPKIRNHIRAARPPFLIRVGAATSIRREKL